MKKHYGHFMLSFEFKIFKIPQFIHIWYKQQKTKFWKYLTIHDFLDTFLVKKHYGYFML